MSTKKKQAKQNVRIREKELHNGSKSLYLDIYFNGKRNYEFLKLYIVKPKNVFDRDNNKKNYALAENIRSKRQLELHNGTYGFTSDFKLNTNFITYFRELINKRKESKGNYGNWRSTLKHLIDFCGEDVSFGDIDERFVQDFKEYLQNEAKTKSETNLSTNSQNSYFNKFRAGLNQAFDEKIINDNPAKRVKGIKAEQPVREYLTIEELRKLAKTECRYDVLKRAFIFSCLTGLRWSDVHKLKWSEVQELKNGLRIVFKQKKTKGLQYLDINSQARPYMGKEGEPDDRVFIGLRYSAYMNVALQRWVLAAGITKDITFHCGRHTFAVIQLGEGTEIYTLSKLLGHSSLKTTEIYAKIMDEKKREAVNKFPDISL